MRGTGADVEEPIPAAAEAGEPGPAARDVGYEEPRVGSLDLIRRIVVGFVQSLEDAAELLSTSFREEIGGLRRDLERRVVGIVLTLIGGGLATTGVALVLRDWIGRWPPVLLGLAALYLALGGWFLWRSEPKGGE